MATETAPPTLPARSQDTVKGQDLIDLRQVILGDFRDHHQIVLERFSDVRDKIQDLTNAIVGERNQHSSNVAPDHPTVTIYPLIRPRMVPQDSTPNPCFSCQDIDERISRLAAELQQKDESLREQRERDEQRLADQARGFNVRFSELSLEKRKLQDRVARLQAVITKNATNDNEPLDNNVIRDFSDLRDQIQTIVHRLYDKSPAQLKKTTNGDLWEKQKFFFRNAGYFNDEVYVPTRQFRARAKIFELLHAKILSAPCFGADDETEPLLADFEDALISVGQGRSSEIIEWRRRTVECASWLDIRSSKPGRVATHIAKFMEPLLRSEPKHPHPGVLPFLTQHLNSLDRLCQDAYKLALLLRRSKSHYRCEIPASGIIIDEEAESKVTAQAFDTGRVGEERGSQVAFTIFGALVKSQPGNEELYILEKAHVVCQLPLRG